jgi:hypothetical protein
MYLLQEVTCFQRLTNITLFALYKDASFYPTTERGLSTMAGEKVTFDENDYVKDAVVSKIINRSVSALRLDRHKKRGIPYVKMGGSVVYRVGDVYAYLEKCRVVPEAT